MTLKEIRTKFVELSGRSDLVEDTTDYVDAGADFFIKAASRFLDRRGNTGGEEASGFYAVNIDAFFLELTECRVVEEVWADDGSVRNQLIDSPEYEILNSFPGLLTNAKSGFPAKYSVGFYRIKEGNPTADFLVGAQTDVTKFNGIIFPPTDRVLTMEVKGKFYSETLTDNGDENYWSIYHEMLLVWASLYQLEISYRNTEGAKDWLASIDNTLIGIEFDLVDQEGINIKQLKG